VVLLVSLEFAARSLAITMAQKRQKGAARNQPAVAYGVTPRSAKTNTSRESPIVKAIVARLKQERHCVVRKRHGTAFCYAGDPDLYGSLRGRHFEIEVKRPGCEPTELQRARLADWCDSGALSGWATSVAEALAIVEIHE
jgi:hypothetical protein